MVKCDFFGRHDDFPESSARESVRRILLGAGSLPGLGGKGYGCARAVGAVGLSLGCLRLSQAVSGCLRLSNGSSNGIACNGAEFLALSHCLAKNTQLWGFAFFFLRACVAGNGVYSLFFILLDIL